MKDAIKLILEIISLGKLIYKEYRKMKNASKKKAFREAFSEHKLDILRKLNLGRNTKP